MNCQEFESTLNVMLDLRENPRSDSALMEHSDNCDFCSTSLEIYAAMGEYTEKAKPTSLDARRRFTGYVAAVTAAALLFLLLTPLGDYFAREQGQVNMAHANVSPPANGDAVNSGQTVHDPEFWQKRPLSQMVPLNKFAFQVPQAPNLEEVGQSINSVWKSIQEDQFLLPIIKQSALFWMPKL